MSTPPRAPQSLRGRYEEDTPPHIPRCEGFAEYVRIGRELADTHLNYETLPGHPLIENWGTQLPGSDENTDDEYSIGGRSPLGWVLDRYRVKPDPVSGIVNDPNLWMREQGNPRYVVDLIGSLVTLSLRTQALIAELPGFIIYQDGEMSR